MISPMNGPWGQKRSRKQGAEAETKASAAPAQEPSDAASPEDFWENMDPGDPFTEYERLAEREAEQALSARGEKTPENEEKPLFLFDADDEFITAPVEAHIAGQKKIDHYLSLFDIAREVSAIQDFDEFWDAVLFAVMGQLGAQTVAVFAARAAGESAQVFYPVAVSGFNPDDSWVMKPGDRLYDLCAQEDGVLYAQNLRAPDQAVLLSEMERAIITESGAEIIAPLRNNKRMYGVVLFGPTFSGDEYSIDDLEFITLLGGLASSGVDRILARLEFDRDTETLRKRGLFSQPNHGGCAGRCVCAKPGRPLRYSGEKPDGTLRRGLILACALESLHAGVYAVRGQPDQP
jgi:hypothetical protein